MIVAGLAPEAIAFMGEFTAAWERFRPAIRRKLRAFKHVGFGIRFVSALVCIVYYPIRIRSSLSRTQMAL